MGLGSNVLLDLDARARRKRYADAGAHNGEI